MTTCVVFEVEGKSKLPSSYFLGDAKNVDELMQKVLDYYTSHECSVAVLMGSSIQSLTQRVVVPVQELLEH